MACKAIASSLRFQFIILLTNIRLMVNKTLSEISGVSVLVLMNGFLSYFLWL